jgi:DNA-binding NtrC family response regulator
VIDSKDTNAISSALAQFGLAGPEVASLREARRSFERSYILAVLEQHHWRVGAAARALGLQRPNLYRKARQLRITLRPNGSPTPTA